MLISTAHAQTAATAPVGVEGQLLSFLPIILMFVVLYFLMIRPQMKRAKEHRALLDALQKGDEVITSGGMVGKVVKVTEAYAVVDVSNGGTPVELNFQKQAIQNVLPKGTIKAI